MTFIPILLKGSSSSDPRNLVKITQWENYMKTCLHNCFRLIEVSSTILNTSYTIQINCLSNKVYFKVLLPNTFYFSLLLHNAILKCPNVSGNIRWYFWHQLVVDSHDPRSQVGIINSFISLSSSFNLIMHRALEFFPSHRIPLASLLVS